MPVEGARSSPSATARVLGCAIGGDVPGPLDRSPQSASPHCGTPVPRSQPYGERFGVDVAAVMPAAFLAVGQEQLTQELASKAGCRDEVDHVQRVRPSNSRATRSATPAGSSHPSSCCLVESADAERVRVGGEQVRLDEPLVFGVVHGSTVSRPSGCFTVHGSRTIMAMIPHSVASLHIQARGLGVQEDRSRAHSAPPYASAPRNCPAHPSRTRAVTAPLSPPSARTWAASVSHVSASPVNRL